MNPLRIMTWNLLEGGHTPGVVPPQVSPARTQAAQRLVEETRPDVLILNEALWAQPLNGYHCDYSALFGFSFSCARLYADHWGNAILSRFPIIACQDFRIYNRGGLISVIHTPQGMLQVGSYHPHPSRYPLNKASDYRALVEAADPGTPLIVGGDFNAISPEDQPNHGQLTQAFEAFSSNPGPDSARFIDGGREVFAALAAAGMREGVPLEARRPTIPTRLIAPNHDSGMRIDHLWVNQHVDVVQGGVEHSVHADVASDHYPVLLEVNLST